jgi:hypothetical protein
MPNRFVEIVPCIHDQPKVIRHKLEAMRSLAVPSLQSRSHHREHSGLDCVGQLHPCTIDLGKIGWDFFH